jgi:hypothetical protein
MLASLNCLGEDIVVAPVIVPELEFRKVGRQVLLADLVIGADDAALQDRPEALDGVGVDGANDVLLLAVVNSAVAVKAIRQIAVVRGGIGGEQADLGGDSLGEEVVHREAVGVVDDPRHDVALPLDRAGHGELVLAAKVARALVPMPVLVLAADESLIDLYDAHQAAEFLVHQGGTYTVAHVPSRLVGTETHRAMDLQSRDAFLAGQHHVDDAEPVAERLVGVLENGSGDMGEAVAAVRRAVVTLPAVDHRRDLRDLIGAAARTANAGRPAMADKVLCARILMGEGLFPLRDGHLVNALFAGHLPVSLKSRGKLSMINVTSQVRDNRHPDGGERQSRMSD